MKTKSKHLNEYLFMQIEKIVDNEIKGETLAEEIKRSEALAKLSVQVIENSRLSLKAEEFRSEHLSEKAKLPEYFGD